MKYTEEQRLNLWWIYIIIGLETFVVASVLIFDKNTNWQHMKEIFYSPFLALLLPYIIVYVITKNLFTFEIDECGIQYRFWPFGRRKKISWTKVEELYMRKYDALGEYGGWGAKHRLWFKLNDKAYIFNDKNVGLQLVLSDQKKILFSTNKLDELTLFLINLKRQNNIGAIETDVRER